MDQEVGSVYPHAMGKLVIIFSVRLKGKLAAYLMFVSIWTLTRENLAVLLAKLKGADQTAHPRSLISAFVIRFLKSIYIPLAASKKYYIQARICS